MTDERERDTGESANIVITTKLTDRQEPASGNY